MGEGGEWEVCVCLPNPAMGEGGDRVCASPVRPWVMVGRGRVPAQSGHG